VVYLATTNFVKRLDFRLTNRPSRFDEVIATRPPSGRVREAYFRRILPAGAAEDGHLIGGSTVDKLVAASKGMYFAHMKELAIAHWVYKHPLDAVAERIRELADNKSTGFSPDTEQD